MFTSYRVPSPISLPRHGCSQRRGRGWAAVPVASEAVHPRRKGTGVLRQNPFWTGSSHVKASAFQVQPGCRFVAAPAARLCCTLLFRCHGVCHRLLRRCLLSVAPVRDGGVYAQDGGEQGQTDDGGDR